MDSSGFVPWYNRPAREFPAKRWLRQRYGFTVPPLAFARLRGSQPIPAWRRFPALVWAEERRAGFAR